MSADAFKTIIISCFQEQSTKMIYTTKPKGTIKVDALHPEDESFEITDDFTIKRLKSLLLDYNNKGYETVSVVNGSSRGGKTGLTLDSTIVLSKRYVDIW